MDPPTVNSAPFLGFPNNAYEGLVRRGTDMAIDPALAKFWEPIGEGKGWRFSLRKDVTFHDGSDFDAADMLFQSLIQSISSTPLFTPRVRKAVAGTARWFRISSATPKFFAKALNGVLNPRHLRGVELIMNVSVWMS